MIGWPQQDRAGVFEQIREVRRLEPNACSFGILTPYPGTDQYDEYKEADLLFERNLDRYDGTTLVWRHPHFTPEELSELMFECYRRFYNYPDLARSIWTRWASFGRKPQRITWGGTLHSRFSAWRQQSPFLGLAPVKCDAVKDYQAYRRRTFDIDLVPLPNNLKLAGSGFATRA